MVEVAEVSVDAQPIVTPMILGAVIMATITIAAVVTVAIMKPSDASIITTIVGVSSPIILGLLAAGLQGIHKLTNSNLSVVKRDLAVARARIEELHDTATVLAKEKSESQVEVALNTTAPRNVGDIIVSKDVAIESLKKIDENTAAIKENTAKTQNDVASNKQDIADLQDKKK